MHGTLPLIHSKAGQTHHMHECSVHVREGKEGLNSPQTDRQTESQGQAVRKKDSQTDRRTKQAIRKKGGQAGILFGFSALP
mmetsp:Transcript_27966/g.54801  ORF Transcript_27966/g.54801 Transcript_27966/m.54801 type:complete len:81 (-) Transcript_27966:288-530(-)